MNIWTSYTRNVRRIRLTNLKTTPIRELGAEAFASLVKMKNSPSVNFFKVLLLAALLLVLCVLSFFALWPPEKPMHSKGADSFPIRWSFTPGPDPLSGIALGPNGAVYFAAATGIYALSPAGQLLWKTPLPSGPVVAALTVAPDGTIYGASRSGKLFALDTSGSLIWESVSTQHRLLTPPVFSNDGALYVTDDYSDIFAFAPGRDANLHWKRTTYSNVPDSDGVLLGNNYPGYGSSFTSPVIGANGTIYLAHQSWLYQISASGEVAHYTQFYGGAPGFPAIGGDGTIYVGGYNSAAIAAIDGHGNALWGMPTAGHVKGSPVIDSAGIIYFCDSGFAKAFTSDGRQKWSLLIPCNSGPALAADGTLYLGSNGAFATKESHKFFLTAITSAGQVKSKIEIHGMVVDAPAIAPDGTIFFTTDQGYVYAVSDAGSPPMDSPWPRFQHDAQNSGRAKLSR